MVNLQSLSLSRNSISTIEKNSFSMMSQLRELILAENKLEAFEDGAFNGLANLSKLHLECNPLKSIKKDQLLELVNLQSIDLRNTKLDEQIEKEHFENCKNKVKVIGSFKPVQFQIVQRLHNLTSVGNQNEAPIVLPHRRFGQTARKMIGGRAPRLTLKVEY